MPAKSRPVSVVNVKMISDEHWDRFATGQAPGLQILEKAFADACASLKAGGWSEPDATLLACVDIARRAWQELIETDAKHVRSNENQDPHRHPPPPPLSGGHARSAPSTAPGWAATRIFPVQQGGGRVGGFRSRRSL